MHALHRHLNLNRGLTAFFLRQAPTLFGEGGEGCLVDEEASFAFCAAGFCRLLCSMPIFGAFSFWCLLTALPGLITSIVLHLPSAFLVYM